MYLCSVVIDDKPVKYIVSPNLHSIQIKCHELFMSLYSECYSVPSLQKIFETNTNTEGEYINTRSDSEVYNYVFCFPLRTSGKYPGVGMCAVLGYILIHTVDYVE